MIDFERMLSIKRDGVTEVGADGKETNSALHYEMTREGDESPEVRAIIQAMARELGVTEEDIQLLFS